jgi:hypothetical protein
MRGVKYMKVEGHESLVRDSQSKAIIAVDDREYENYMVKRKRDLENHKAIRANAEEIENIKKNLSEIKGLLTKLLEGK